MRGFQRIALPLLVACSTSSKNVDSPESHEDTGAADGAVDGSEDTDSGDRDSGDRDSGDTDDSGETDDSGDSGDTGSGDTGSEPAWTDGAHSCVEARYRPYAVQGWEVCADEGIFEDSDHGTAVLELLASDLAHIRTIVPATAVGRLQGVRVWVEESSDWAGGVYHPSASWLADNGYPTHWAESIQIANSANYLSWTAIQPAIVLHELSHAWHHQVVGYSDPQIAEAYAEAMASGRYESVAYAGGGTARAYATTDDREYFAELSEAWFWENDFYPFVRSELEEFDPLGAAVVEASWAQ